MKYPASKSGQFPDFPSEIEKDSALIEFIKTNRRPIQADELNGEMKKIIPMNAGLVIPCLIKDDIFGLLILGPKQKGYMYTGADIAIFGILANQLGLAIENTEYFNEWQAAEAKLHAAEQMAVVGTMAAGMSHQINNRLNIVGMAAYDVLDTLKHMDLSMLGETQKKDIDYIIYGLERIKVNVEQGGKISNKFLSFSDLGKLLQEAQTFNLNEVVDKAIETVKINKPGKDGMISKELSDNGMYLIKGARIFIEEIIANLIDNGLDAIHEKEQAFVNKTIPAQEGYQGKVNVKLTRQESKILLEISDNGIGMKDEIVQKVFVPYFTTKATTVKGNGMGMYAIQKIIQAHDGTIEVKTKLGEGTTVTINLPMKLEADRA